ncbi:MAG: AI-2E family transporter [Pyrinomonadaceae bacterium]|nr:AI-2E family transporter [Pyrinomonadaceae bacterium]
MSEKKIRELKQTARRVFLDPSTPSTQSILRVVLVVFLGILLVGLFGTMLYWLRSLIFLLILSIFFAYLLNPLVSLIRRPFKSRNLDRFMPRSLAIVLAYLIVFTVLGLSISYLAPRIAEQARQLGANIPTYTVSIQTWFKDIGNRYERYRVPEQIQEEVNKKIAEYLGEIGKTLPEMVGELLLTILGYLPWIVLIPILSFFFLKDVNLFRISLLRLFPTGNWRLRAESFLEDVNKTLAGYTRAQLISCFLIGSVCFLGFYILNLNYALLLGIMAGILEFIPLVGPLIVALTAITIGAFYSPWQALYVAVFLFVLRMLQDYVFYPRIVREGIHLHPLAIILSVLAGEQIGGITGVFLSIPVVALVTVLLKHIREHRGSKGLVADLLVEEKEKDLGEKLAT